MVSTISRNKIKKKIRRTRSEAYDRADYTRFHESEAEESYEESGVARE